MTSEKEIKYMCSKIKIVYPDKSESADLSIVKEAYRNGRFDLLFRDIEDLSKKYISKKS